MKKFLTLGLGFLMILAANQPTMADTASYFTGSGGEGLLTQPK
jgi:hypothetical protein